jgi:Domain of unknown function (DUF4192)
MTTSEETLRLNSPGELLETVPYLLGFHPEASVVLVGIDDDHVAVTARIDLAAARDFSAIGSGVRVLKRADATAAVVIVYASADDRAMQFAPAQVPLPNLDVVERVRSAIRSARLSAIDAFFVQDGRWWSYSGRAAGRPDGVRGEPLPGDRAIGPASAVFAGLQARPSRAAVEAVLDQDPDSQRERCLLDIEFAEHAMVQAALEGELMRVHRSVKRALFAAAREADRALFPSPRSDLTAGRLSRFAVGLSEIAIRDALWLAIDQERLDGRAFWLQLLQRLPSPYDSAPLFLFGWATWRDGNGTLAAMAAQRALASEPGYTAAELLLSAIQSGLDPFRTPKLRPRAVTGGRDH